MSQPISTGRRTAWALAGALLLAAGALQAAPGADGAPPPGMMPVHMGPGGGGMMGGPMMDGHGMDRMLALVNATADQKAKVRDIFKAAHQDLHQQHSATQALHQQMAALMTAPVIDPVAAEALRQKMMAQRDASSKRMMQAMLDASAVLTADQRQQLGTRMNQMRDLMQRQQREREQLAPRNG